MAIDTKLREQLAKHVKLGSKTGYLQRNDANDKSTMTDPGDLLEVALQKKQYLEILQAIYDVSSDSKFNGKPYAVTMSDGKFILTNIKTSESTELNFKATKTKFEVSDKLSNKTTIIELNKVIETGKSEAIPFKTQVESILKNNKTDKDIISALNSALNNRK